MATFCYVILGFCDFVILVMLLIVIRVNTTTTTIIITSPPTRRVRLVSYRPNKGFAAARMEARAFRVALIPAYLW
jgi:hypothetical protein